MGTSLSLLTAALLVTQSPATGPGGQNCPCNKSTQGYVAAQVEDFNETRTMGWWTRRTTTAPSGNTTATTEAWRGSVPSEGSWIDNRPVLSRIKGWFNRDTVEPRMEVTQPSSPTIVPSAPLAQEQYRRLPTTKEPPLGAPVSAPARSPVSVPVAPAQVKPGNAVPLQRVPTAPRIVAPANEPPLTIEVAPIEFRTAGQAKGFKAPELGKPSNDAQARDAAPSALAPAAPAAPAIAAPGAPVVSSSSNRPNPISPRLINKVGQPGDYSWITGQLEIRGNMLILHYATPDTIDRYNGSLVLSYKGDMSRFRNGDLVSTHGNVIQLGRGPAYQVTTIDLVER